MLETASAVIFINIQLLIFIWYYNFEKHMEDTTFFTNKYKKEVEEALGEMLNSIRR